MFRAGSKTTVIVFLVVAGAFGWGVFELLIMRFETGEMFPAYSSYRNDPVGTKALFASLNRVREMEAVRYVDTLTSRAEAPADQTLLIIGANTEQPRLAPRAFVEDIDAVIARGGRVVLAFAPDAFDFEIDEALQRGAPGIRRGPQDENNEENERIAALADPTVELKEHWGIELRHDRLRLDGDGNLITHEAVSQIDDGLPESLEWHNGLYFNLSSDDWRAVYTDGENTVAAEREFGEGTLVFFGDPYYLTNEGLAADRQPELLAWLIGANAFVQFDEYHLGMQRNPGAAALMRRYNLESLVIGFIALALLFAWRSASSLAPRYSDTLPVSAGELERGRDAHAGFANLVQRSTPPSEVVTVCVNQWRESVLPGMGRADAKEIGDALAKTAQDYKASAAVDAYRHVLNQLRERNVITAYDRKS